MPESRKKRRRLHTDGHEEEVAGAGFARGQADRPAGGAVDLPAFDQGDPQAGQAALRPAAHRRFEPAQQTLPATRVISAVPRHPSPAAAGWRQSPAGRAAAGHDDGQLPLLERGDDPVARVEKFFDGLDRDHGLVGRDPLVDRHAAAGVEGGDIVGDAPPALQLQLPARRVTRTTNSSMKLAPREIAICFTLKRISSGR